MERLHKTWNESGKWKMNMILKDKIEGHEKLIIYKFYVVHQAHYLTTLL